MSPVVRLLARQVWTQARADRAHGVWLAYLAVCGLAVPLASGLSLGAGSRAAVDTGLLGLWGFTCLLAVWLGVRAIGAELSEGRAVCVLSGPLPVRSWLVGRGLGVASVLAAAQLGMLGIWIATATLRGLPIGPSLVVFALYTWTEGLLLAAVAALLASRARALVASLSTGGLWLAGHLASEYTRLMTEWQMPWLAGAVFAIVPDLDRLNAQSAVVHDLPLLPAQIGADLAYSALWLTAVCVLLTASAQRRDLA